MRTPPPDRVQSLARGLAVIRCFDADSPSRTLSDVARATGLTRATARRFLLTLTDLGYVRSDAGTFSLTPLVLELGYSYLSGLRLPDLAQPHLRDLAERVGESTSVSVLDSADVVYVAREQVSRIMAVSITIGTRFPAHVTSMGRVLLAGLPPAELDAVIAAASFERLTDTTVAGADQLRRVLDRVRNDGYCVVDQELEPGLRSIAAPVRSADGTVAAAVNVSTPAGRYDVSELTGRILPLLTATAAAIEADLRRAGPG
ncbi:IclR family transcriptional regulator C-terminal domain-containing protein [Tomitella fengzijianii]|uniref:Glycerol operon regulatory protein n=1 Tax=Tomitella fengzijianii TaxID=2597660 RepID=A0A516X8F0_9ACTN|nr:IclR family transcriptional regulator C-terminal domain-containing protein [Tomitella fengzijianii]QDQ99340.1 helix-turn-helix domain-containing protein [Tomitella fengzijianii]